MSYHDITQENTVFEIKGKKYIIEFDNTIIALMQKKYDCKFFELASKIDEIKNSGIEEILEFCQFGFLKHQPKIKITELAKVQSYGEVFNYCCNELLRKIIMPDVFNELVHIDNEKKKKAKTGLISTICSMLHLK